MKRRGGFTLVEIVLVVGVIFILAAIGAWRLSTIKNEAVSVAADNALDVVRRMQQLSDLEGLPQNSLNVLERIKELQAQLSAKGHSYYQYNPTNLAEMVDFDATAHKWVARPAP